MWKLLGCSQVLVPMYDAEWVTTEAVHAGILWTGNPIAHVAE